MSFSTISGLISVLEGNDLQLKSYALNSIHSVVDQFWPELTQSIETLKSLLDDTKNSPQNHLICSIISKVYYHTDQIPLSFQYCVRANNLFDFKANSLYAKTLKEYALQLYIENSRQIHKREKSAIAPEVHAVFENIIKNLHAAKDYQNIFALAADTRSPNLFERSLSGGLHGEPSAAGKKGILDVAFKVAKSAPKEIQQTFLPLAIFHGVRSNLLGPLEYARLKLQINDIRGVANLLTALTVGFEVNSHLSITETNFMGALRKKANIALQKEEISQPGPIRDVNSQAELAAEYELLALQIAFDVAEGGDKKLVGELLESYCVPYYACENTLALGETRVELSAVLEHFEGFFDAQRALNELRKAEEASLNGDSISDAELLNLSKTLFPEHFARSTAIRRILSGSTAGYLQLQCLFTLCSRSAPELGAVMQKVGNRNAVTSAALVAAHSFARCGTAQDGFVRRNTAWFAALSNWTKFSAVAGLGAVHRGNSQHTLQLLSAFLPRQGDETSPYQVGGALFALGLVHSRDGADKVDYLIDALEQHKDNDIILHGGCLALGICSLAAADKRVDDALKKVLFQDNAVSGQAAAMAIGLNNMGHAGSSAGRELFDYARQTKHEKITRGAVVGLSLIAYRSEARPVFADEMLCSQDEILRYGGCFCLALAFAGTEDGGVLQRLLKVAAADACGDVRRAAILSVTFLFCRSRQKVPPLLKLFAESFDPHSRYGAALAIGISSAGSGSEAALKTLDSLITDKSDFVKNAALMASSLVLVQSGQDRKERVELHLARICKVLKNKSANDFPSFSKSGAIVAIGLLQMGGGNCSLPLVGESGMLLASSIAGVLLFMQSWYWFPLQHFLALAIAPNAFIGVNSELKVPTHHHLFCNSKGDYTFPKLDMEERRQAVKEASLTLSISGKSEKEKRRRKKDSEETKEGNELATKEEKIESETTKEGTENGTVERLSWEEEWVAETKRRLGENRLLQNPFATSEAQKAAIGNFCDQRYQPVRRGFGVVLLKDTRPGEKEHLTPNRFIHRIQWEASNK